MGKVKSRILLKMLFCGLLGIGMCGLSACAKKTKSSELSTDASGVGDTVKFYGSDISPEQERQLLNKNTYYFGYDSNQLSDEDTLSLYAHAKKIITRPSASVRVEGHTDERGSREYNVALGERRAKAISNTLMMKGVSERQINIVSYGKEKPQASGHDEASWSQNRRGVVVYEAE